MQMNSKPVHVQHSDFQDLVTSFEKTKIKESALPVFIDTEIGMCSMVGKLQDLPTNPPSLYIDLEGINLLRHGSISILQIFVLPHGNTYLIDVFTLKENAFLQPAAVGDQNLKQILESSTIPKVFFDVRNDSDALFSHFKIHLAGVQDIQLMELATRNYSKKYVKGLAKCIEKDAPVSVSEMQSWKMWKEKGLELFAPERGGSYEIFNVRPLPDEIMQYCVQDVCFLPKLWQHYHRRLTPKWSKRVLAEVENRIRLSQSAEYDGKGQNKALAPAGWAWA